MSQIISVSNNKVHVDLTYTLLKCNIVTHYVDNMEHKFPYIVLFITIIKYFFSYNWMNYYCDYIHSQKAFVIQYHNLGYYVYTYII